MSTAAPLYTFFEWAAFADPGQDGVFLLKNGNAAAVLAIDGRDTECLDAAEILDITHRLEGALRTIDWRFRLYQYAVKRRAGRLFSVRLYFVLVFEGHASGLRNTVLNGLKPRDIARAAAILRTHAERFVTHLGDMIPARALDAEETFRFLAALVNYDARRLDAAQLTDPDAINWQACMSEVEGFRGRVRVGDQFARILTLKTGNPEKAMPETTVPDFLRTLREAPVESIIVTEYKPLDPRTTRKKLEALAEHHHRNRFSSDWMTAVTNMLAGFISGARTDAEPARQDQVEIASGQQTDEAMKATRIDGMGLGELSMTVIVIDPDPTQLNTAVSLVQAAAGRLHIALYEEDSMAELAWRASMPGALAKLSNHRRMVVSEAVYADLSLVFAPARGDSWNAHLNAPCLTTLETRQQTPFYLNLHVQDVAHALITGKPGAGKTFTAKHLLSQARERYGALIITLDLKDSYGDQAVANGGAHVDVGRRSRFAINPFSLPPGEDSYTFLHSLITVLLEQDAPRLTDEEKRAVWHQVLAVYSLPREMRRLGQVLLPGDLQSRLWRWIGDGQFGWLFDSGEPDSLTFADWQSFSFRDLDQAILQPLLFYVLTRASRVIAAPENAHRFKILLLDEAWLLFDNPAIRATVKSGLKVWRDRNAAVILTTQSGDDLERSQIFEVIRESVATKLLLANPGADRAFYRDKLGLNEQQIEHVLTLRMKQEMLVIQNGCAKIARLNINAAAERPIQRQLKEAVA